LYTVDTALESLKKYDISESNLLEWEKALGLDIAVDAYGRKQYSPHHINLFKNVKKHLALGRTLDEIRNIIVLPPLSQSRPQDRPFLDQAEPVLERPGAIPSESTAPVGITDASQADLALSLEPLPSRPPADMGKSPYASAPGRPVMQTSGAAPGARPAAGSASAGPVSAEAANVIHLVQRLTQEKDHLYTKLLETEKLNSHLYSANSLFHKKTSEMSRQISQLKESLNENERFKLLDDKARLHKQLLDLERVAQRKQDEVDEVVRDNAALRAEIEQYRQRVQALSIPFDPEKFRGDWMEAGRLVDVLYDNFGINIESERARLFRISDVSLRCYGRMAIVHTHYQYETNNLWRRDETLAVAYTDEDTLEGELTAEYILDGVPVAKALYRVTCRRHS
jgi:hypothetical protein